jgi:hypothetical protein
MISERVEVCVIEGYGECELFEVCFDLGIGEMFHQPITERQFDSPC